MAVPTMKTKQFCAHAQMAWSIPAMAAKASLAFVTIPIVWTAMPANVIVSKSFLSSSFGRWPGGRATRPLSGQVKSSGRRHLLR